MWEDTAHCLPFVSASFFLHLICLKCMCNAASNLFIDRSCCQSARATEIVGCLSIPCYLGRTPVLELPNTSMWSTSVNQVSSAAFISLSPPVNCHVPPYSACFNIQEKNHTPCPHYNPPSSSPPPLYPLWGFFSPYSAEHKRHVACEGETMVLRCKPPRVLNIYAAVYGRGLSQSDTCPSHLTRPPPFGELTRYSLFSLVVTNR